MLILTRRPGERITIGDSIVFKILEIKGGQVRIGIEAPPETLVHREEVYLKIKEENIRASKTQIKDLEGLATLVPFKEKVEKKNHYGDRHKKIRRRKD